MIKLKLLAAALFSLSLTANAQWQSDGLQGNYILSLAPKGTNIFAGTLNAGVFKQTTSPAWSLSGLSAAPVHSLLVSGNNIFAAYHNDTVYQSTNDGGSWQPAHNGLNADYTYALLQKGSDLYAGTNAGIYKSSNNGVSWTSASTGLLFAPQIETFLVDGATIYAGLHSGGVYKSTNDGASWTAANSGMVNLDVYALAKMGTALIAGTSVGIYRSVDAGSSWTNITNGISSVASVYALTTHNGTLIAGAEPGIFLSTNNGLSWTSFNGGLTNTHVHALAINSTTLFAGTGDGVFKTALSNIPASVADLSRSGWRLYPNPSTGIFRLVQEGASADILSIRVVDVVGRLVVMMPVSSAQKEITIDLSMEQKGLYFLSISSKEKAYSGTLLLK